jgi:hypothetical protein
MGREISNWAPVNTYTEFIAAISHLSQAERAVVRYAGWARLKRIEIRYLFRFQRCWSNRGLVLKAADDRETRNHSAFILSSTRVVVAAAGLHEGSIASELRCKFELGVCVHNDNSMALNCRSCWLKLRTFDSLDSDRCLDRADYMKGNHHGLRPRCWRFTLPRCRRGPTQLCAGCRTRQPHSGGLQRVAKSLALDNRDDGFSSSRHECFWRRRSQGSIRKRHSGESSSIGHNTRRRSRVFTRLVALAPEFLPVAQGYPAAGQALGLRECNSHFCIQSAPPSDARLTGQLRSSHGGGC